MMASKYVFLTLPAYGHVNPALAVAEELVKRGQEVIYYLSDPFQEAVQATGAGFRRYDSQLEHISPVAITHGIPGGILARMVDESRHVLPQVLDRIRAEQPSCIVYETMCVWARIVVQALNVPALTLRATYAMNEHVNVFTMTAPEQSEALQGRSEAMEKISTELRALCEKYHVPPFDLRSAFTHAEQLNIVFLPREFQPSGDTFDDRYVFVGPSILARHGASDFPLGTLNSERPILYISLGTVFNNQPEFFRSCFEAFGETPWQVLLSRGGNVDPADLGPVPNNFLVSAYVPQLDILKRARVFVTHSGMNSTMESLYYGVPMVCVPQMIEQNITARRIGDMGLGIMLETAAVNVTTLREAVERVAHDVIMRERVRQMQQITREAGGYQRAVEAIMQFEQNQPSVHHG